MKKMIFAGTLALLSATLFSATAFADDEKSVQANYQANAPVVVSVDVTWGSLAFTYSEGSGRTWNPETHKFTSGTGLEAGWHCEEGANEITIVNHSNTAVTPYFQYQPSEGFEEIQVDFGNYQLSEYGNRAILPVPEGSENGRSDVAELSLDGSLAAGVDKAEIGTITLNIDSGVYFEGGREYRPYLVTSGLQNNKIELARFYSMGMASDETALAYFRENAERDGTRLIGLDEVEALLKKVEQTNPVEYNERVKRSVVVCEDGWYTPSENSEDIQYYFAIGVKDKEVN